MFSSMKSTKNSIGKDTSSSASSLVGDDQMGPRLQGRVDEGELEKVERRASSMNEFGFLLPDVGV